MDDIIKEQKLLNSNNKFNKYFIVKIAGKGNINKKDNRYKELKLNLSKTVN